MFATSINNLLLSLQPLSIYHPFALFLLNPFPISQYPYKTSANPPHPLQPLFFPSYGPDDPSRIKAPPTEWWQHLNIYLLNPATTTRFASKLSRRASSEPGEYEQNDIR